MVGLLLGVIIHNLLSVSDTSASTFINIPHYQIQNFLISPIILHAAFKIYKPHFFKQFNTIMSMAIFGTLMNAILIAVTLRYVHIASNSYCCSEH